MNAADADNGPQLFTPQQAAETLGVSASGLRRLASIYAELYGELPRDPDRTGRTSPRVWPVEAVARLRRARELVTTGKQRSIADALRVVEAGDSGLDIPASLVGPGDAPRGQVLKLLRALLEAQQETSARLEALEAENRALRRQLAAPPAPEGVRRRRRIGGRIWRFFSGEMGNE